MHLNSLLANLNSSALYAVRVLIEVELLRVGLRGGGGPAVPNEDNFATAAAATSRRPGGRRGGQAAALNGRRRVRGRRRLLLLTALFPDLPTALLGPKLVAVLVLG